MTRADPQTGPDRLAFGISGLCLGFLALSPSPAAGYCDPQHVCEGALEAPDDGVDSDGDGLELYTIAEDASKDSPDPDAELIGAAIGWNESTLVFSFSYVTEQRATIWYIDLDTPLEGANEFSSSSGYRGEFPTNVSMAHSIEFMLGVYTDWWLKVYRILEDEQGGTSIDLTNSSSSIRACVTSCAPGAATAFVRIPWTLLYDDVYRPDSTPIESGATLRLVGLTRGGDNAPPADTCPDNESGATSLEHFVEVPLDPDGDGEADVDALAALMDGDGDGYSVVRGDCDDTDPTRYPGASWFLDADHDGYGGSASEISCAPPSADYVAITGDCQDDSSAIHPNVLDTCEDGIDDDCDGAIDEGELETCDGSDNDCDGEIDDGIVHLPSGHCVTSPGMSCSIGSRESGSNFSSGMLLPLLALLRQRSRRRQRPTPPAGPMCGPAHRE